LFGTLNEFKISSIKSINLQNNQLDDKCMKSLGELLQNNESEIEEINISENNITDKGMEILFPYLIKNKTLKSLNVFGNEGITEKSIPFLIELVEKSFIDELNVSKTSITNQKIFIYLLTTKILQGNSKIIILSSQ